MQENPGENTMHDIVCFANNYPIFTQIILFYWVITLETMTFIWNGLELKRVTSHSSESPRIDNYEPKQLLYRKATNQRNIKAS